MRKYKTVKVEREEQQLESITCDLCGETGKRVCGTDSIWDRGHDWDTFETKVSIEEKSSYPEGGSSEEEFVDICPSCFRDKLIVWLKSQGAAMQKKTVDW